MKFSPVAAILFLSSGVSNAAIIEYNYTAPDMSVEYYYLNETGDPFTNDLIDVTDDPSRWLPWHQAGVGVGFSFIIDTELLEDRFIAFDYSWEMPAGYHDNYANVINETRIALDENYHVSWFNVAIDYGFYDGYTVTDGYATEYAGACDSACYSFASHGSGTWTRIIDGIAEGNTDLPAPVPLPAAGGLLVAALAGLGVMKRRNKAASSQ